MKLQLIIKSTFSPPYWRRSYLDSHTPDLHPLPLLSLLLFLLYSLFALTCLLILSQRLSVPSTLCLLFSEEEGENDSPGQCLTVVIIFERGLFSFVPLLLIRFYVSPIFFINRKILGAKALPLRTCTCTLSPILYLYYTF